MNKQSSIVFLDAHKGDLHLQEQQTLVFFWNGMKSLVFGFTQYLIEMSQ